MRRAAKQKAVRSQVSQVYSVSSPVGGLNARDPLPRMDEKDASILLNWFPTTTECEVRGGSQSYCTNITGTVKTLAVYNKPDGSNNMFAADDNDIWDVSSSGTAIALSQTVTNGTFQYVNFGDGTNNWLIMVNGEDSPLYYNGSTWTSVTASTSPALIGLDPSSITHVNEFKSRLFFTQRNSLSFWYLSAGAAGGTATEFDLSSICHEGGYLMWMATWSFDGGDGPDDAAVFMTSEGEIVVYRGTDPSSATTWGLIGLYKKGKPLGRRSYIKHEGDLIIITQNGSYPLSKALQSSDKTVAVTDKIEKAFNNDARDFGSYFGWEAIFYPLQSAMLFNIPVLTENRHRQYVMNTITKSWCEFDSWDAECFAMYDDSLYYGQDNSVIKAWVGTNDVGNDIVAKAKSAYNYLGTLSQIKQVNMLRPVIKTNGDLSFYIGLDSDFSEEFQISYTDFHTVQGSTWDTATWDNGQWTSTLKILKNFTSPASDTGYSLAVNLQANINGNIMKWVSIEYVYEFGGLI